MDSYFPDNELSRIKTIILDFPGILVEYDREAELDAFRKIGITDIDEYLTPGSIKGVFRDLYLGKVNIHDFHKKICEIIGKPIIIEELLIAFTEGYKKIHDQVLRNIFDLSDKYIFILVCNMTKAQMLWADTVEFGEDKIPISHYFDKMFCSYQTGHMKSDIQLWDYVGGVSRLAPEETLVIYSDRETLNVVKSLGFQICNTEETKMTELYKQLKN